MIEFDEVAKDFSGGVINMRVWKIMAIDMQKNPSRRTKRSCLMRWV